MISKTASIIWDFVFLILFLFQYYKYDNNWSIFFAILFLLDMIYSFYKIYKIKKNGNQNIDDGK